MFLDSQYWNAFGVETRVIWLSYFDNTLLAFPALSTTSPWLSLLTFISESELSTLILFPLAPRVDGVILARSRSGFCGRAGSLKAGAILVCFLTAGWSCRVSSEPRACVRPHTNSSRVLD